MPRKYDYPYVQKPEDWAILKLSRQRTDAVNETILNTIQRIKAESAHTHTPLADIIAKSMYMEHIRIKEEPWSIDPKDEKPFWRGVKRRLIRNERDGHTDQNAEDLHNTAILREIVTRYTEEIAGRFNMRIFNFARTVLPIVFSRMLNAVSARGIARFFNPTLHIEDKIHLTGEIDAMRELAKKGTVILLPTHSSNLDSVLIGWALDLLGFPPFIYGAGLNLFNSRIFGFFMNRLGAYKVDRRKKNFIYNETLKSFSTIAIRGKCHSLFFPGGTRSRSGALESRLKLGLMGTAIEAQRRNFIDSPNQADNKIFVVPLVLSYHFVLEAPSLIIQHLHNIGQDKFYIEDESSSYWQVLKFVWKFFARKSEMELSFGRPMDVFGNFVDTEGNSYDHMGKKVDIEKNFMSRGVITEDLQRDSEYTRMLGEKVAVRYKAENVIFSSHIVAFVGFELIRRRYPELDVYSLLRIPKDDRGVSTSDMIHAIDRLMERLREMADKREVRLAEHVKNAHDAEILRHGIEHLGLYNDKRPLYFIDGKHIHSQSLNLLHFYYNRLTGYGFESYI